MMDPKKKGALGIEVAIGKPKAMKGGPGSMDTGAAPAAAKAPKRDLLDDMPIEGTEDAPDDEMGEASGMARIESKLDKIMAALQIGDDAEETADMSGMDMGGEEPGR